LSQIRIPRKKQKGGGFKGSKKSEKIQRGKRLREKKNRTRDKGGSTGRVTRPTTQLIQKMRGGLK